MRSFIKLALAAVTASMVALTATPAIAAINDVVTSIAVGPSPAGVAVSPDSKTIYVANYGSNTVSVIDASTHSVTSTVTVGNSPIQVAVTPDGAKLLVSNSGDNTLSVIDLATNAATTISVGFSPQDIAISSDSATAYVVNYGGNSISVINLVGGTVTTTISLGPDDAQFVALSPDNSRLYVSLVHNSAIAVIDTGSNSVVTGAGYPISVGSWPEEMVFSADGSQLFVAQNGDSTISVVDISTNSVSDTIVLPANSEPYGLAITPDGSTLYSANNGSAGGISVGDIASALATTTIPDDGHPFFIDIAADGVYAYVTNLNDNTVTVVQVGEAAPVPDPELPTTGLDSSVLAPMAIGSFLLVGLGFVVASRARRRMR